MNIRSSHDVLKQKRTCLFTEYLHSVLRRCWSGPDRVPARFLQEPSSELARVLSVFFAQSLNSATLPPDWTKVYVSTIFNKNSRHLPDISGTCTFCLDNTTLLVQIRSYIQQGCFYLCLSVHMIKQKVVNYFSFLSPFTHRLTAIFPGGPGLANTRMSPLWTALANGGGDSNCSCKTCKAPVKSSPPTNLHRVFLQVGCLSCRPTNSVRALKGNVITFDEIKFVGGVGLGWL